MKNHLLKSRVEKVLPSREALEKVLNKKKIKLYQGFDPTGGRLHLGHTIGLRKLMDFANEGHEVIFLFGTGTVLVGDPSKRDSARKLITQKEIDENIKNWKKQVEPIVDFSKIEILKNGDWLTELKIKDLVKIGSNISAVQLFKRDSFKKRVKKGDTVWYHETMYPLLQGYDSVVMDVDLEIGGTDQEFNMLVGRELQKKMNGREKFVLTVPMTLGTDGKQMSKTSGNTVWLDDVPNDMFGKIMSIPDSQILPYFELVTNTTLEEVEKIKKEMKSGSLQTIDAKKKLAETVVEEWHGKENAKEAKKHFEETFQKKTPSFEKEIDGKRGLIPTISALESVGSTSQAKRLIVEGAVQVNGKVVDNIRMELKSGDEIKVGKKTFVRIK